MLTNYNCVLKIK